MDEELFILNKKKLLGGHPLSVFTFDSCCSLFDGHCHLCTALGNVPSEEYQTYDVSGAFMCIRGSSVIYDSVSLAYVSCFAVDACCRSFNIPFYEIKHAHICGSTLNVIECNQYKLALTDIPLNVPKVYKILTNTLKMCLALDTIQYEHGNFSLDSLGFDKQGNVVIVYFGNSAFTMNGFRCVNMRTYVLAETKVSLFQSFFKSMTENEAFVSVINSDKNLKILRSVPKKGDRFIVLAKKLFDIKP